MFAKISLTAAFLLIVAPPIACASNRTAASRAPMQLPLRMVLAQDSEPALGTSDNDNDSDSDSNDSTDDNQNADSNQTDQQNAAGDDQPIPPTVLGAPNSGQGEQAEPPQAPQNVYPVNPYQ